MLFLVLQGEWSIFDKAQNIQAAGGKLAILVDFDKNSITTVLSLSISDHSKIHIPMIIIEKDVGDKIIEYYESQFNLQQNPNVHIQVEFRVNKPDDRVEYDVWLSSANEKGLKFIQDFYRLHKLFKSDVLFQPRYFTWSCLSCSQEVKERDWLYNGKYWSFSDYKHGEQGSKIILENLREKCVFLYAKFNGNEKKWWEYMLTRSRLIRESSIWFDKYSEKCSQEAHKLTYISWDDTSKWVDKSLKENNGEENRYLKEDQELWMKLNLHTIPMVVINEQPYLGELDPLNVFKTICSTHKYI